MFGKPSHHLFKKRDLDCRIDYSGGANPIYVGFAIAGSSVSDNKWQIFKLTWDVNNNPTEKKYANGSDDPFFIWDDRASNTY